MRKLLVMTMVTLVTGAVWAQPRFVADAPIKKVGELVWQNPKSISFSIRNEGTEPMVITEVHPSCECIQVSYPPEPISPGDTGRISATYFPKTLGTFHRDLLVYTNVQEAPFYLTFQGRVVETAVDYEGDFPIDLGNVRLNTNYIEFDEVNKGDHPVVELQVANMGNDVYEPQLMHLPNYLNAEYLPLAIQGGRTGKILLTLNSERLFMDGLNQTSIYLARHMGDKVSEENEIVVSAILLPAFRNLTDEELAHAPSMVITDGTEPAGGKVSVTLGGKKRASKILHITNSGDETLTISAVQVSNRAMNVSLGERNIAPHKTEKMKITIDAKEHAKAKNKPRILLISNDPRHAKTELNLNVE